MSDAAVETPQEHPAEPRTTHASVDLLDRLAESVSGRATVGAVYGEPVSREGVTAIPVARVRFGFGGGTGRDVGPAKSGEGGGGGGGTESRPVGFIELKDGAARYQPIRDPWVDIVVPLASVLAGSALPRVVRAVRRRRRC